MTVSANSGVSRRYKTIIEAFEEAVLRHPEKIAVRKQDEILSYLQLHQKSNSVASALISSGVEPGDVVALYLSRSIDLIIAMLGILKAGAAYLPLDKSDPPTRISSILNAARVSVGIGDSGGPDEVQIVEQWVSVRELVELGNEVPNAIFTSATPDNKCYVMFTSGSTGAPKGVVIPHRAVTRLVCNSNYIDIGADDVLVLFSPITFDASTFEIWGALLNGAELVLYSADVFNPKLFHREIDKYGVTILWLTAALFHMVATRYIKLFGGLRVLLAGGDVLYPHVINAVFDSYPDLIIINGYGPTENTTFTCCHAMTTKNRPAESVPIGKPISGTEVFILDSEGNDIFSGDTGELHVAGAGVGLGYISCNATANMDDSENPFYVDEDKASGLLYRTGDLVYRSENGDIFFEGRRDFQVKVRGYRISLEEVRLAIVKIENVDDAIVLVDKLENGDQQLVAYLLKNSVSNLSSDSIKKILAESLPKYMVPDLVCLREDLPINKNGKIDRKNVIELHKRGVPETA
ncbi:amino acid adenylation domain-containing protein [Teredinibacter turnerae]|uniref:amino acid adenylation domain-containing protein n=1 Tax=Teredinibacter turnerae TaxID=2426 RepID=UPI0030CBDBC5